MGSGKSLFNVSLIVRDKVTNKTVSTDYNLFEEKGELKQIQSEVLLLTSLMPFHSAKLAHRLLLAMIKRVILPWVVWANFLQAKFMLGKIHPP